MLVFVDESGGPGRKILNRSSNYLIVALVTFEENEGAEACDQPAQLPSVAPKYKDRHLALGDSSVSAYIHS